MRLQSYTMDKIVTDVRNCVVQRGRQNRFIFVPTRHFNVIADH